MYFGYIKIHTNKYIYIYNDYNCIQKTREMETNEERHKRLEQHHKEGRRQVSHCS